VALDAASFKTRYTEFQSYPDSQIDTLIADGEDEASERVFGTGRTRERAIFAWVAHQLTIQTYSGFHLTAALGKLDKGEPTQRLPTAADLESTQYGRTFLRLRDEYTGPAIMAI